MEETVMDKDSANPLVVTKIHRQNNKLLLRPYFKRKNRPRQSYKPEDVLAAMHAIWRGMSRRKAAKVFNIPRSTLLEKLDGKRPVDASPGPKPFLTKPEERQLEAWAVDMHRRGFPLRTEDLKDMAQDIIERNQRPTSFKKGRPGRSWMRNFLLRHPRVYEQVGPRRTRSVTTREEVRQWCQQLRNFIVPLGHGDILDDPNRIFNVDHGEFLFDTSTGQFLEQHRSERSEELDRERERPERLSSEVECISIVTSFSASGRMGPVMFVYPLKELPHEVMKSLPAGWVGTHSENGFLTGKTFLDYLVALRRWLDDGQVRLPVLLLVDGRRSRLNVDVTRYCEEHGLILYCLFPTPRPAIAELFSALFHDCPQGITKFNLVMRFQEALDALDDTDSSKSVFHTYGILPYLQTMLQTLVELAAEPVQNPFALSSPASEDAEQEGDLISDITLKNEFSDCECDIDLMPVEGEIEVEFPSCWDPHAVAALHPELLTGTGSEAPSYVIVGPNVVDHNVSSREDFVDQPGVSARLVVAPISSPLLETDRGIEEVDLEIDQVLGAIKSTAHSACSEEPVSQPSCPLEEPFLGFSSDDAGAIHNTLDAHCCLRFLEKFLSERGLLEDFKAASLHRQWEGAPESKNLFDAWLAAYDQSHT